MSDLKVLCVGPPKAGTVTLHHAFLEAGLVSSHGRTNNDQPPVALQLWRAFIEDRDPLHYVASGVEAITDAHLTRSKKWDGLTVWPCFVPGFLRAFRAHHPEVLVLLHTREPESWVASVGRWKDLKARIGKAELPFLPMGVGNEVELADWIEGHYARVRRAFAGDQRFLEIAIDDPEAPRRIGDALGLDLPWWGILNANPETENYRAMVLEAVKSRTRKPV